METKHLPNPKPFRAMRRRHLVGVLGTLVGAGCISVSDEIRIVFENNTFGDTGVELQVSRDAVVFAEELTVRSDNRSEVNPGITQPGQYQIAITVDTGLEETYTWDVEDVDVRMGSNAILSIYETELRLRVEQ
jgi:hypothetical protein